jgi:hypothetical protein
MPKILQMLKRGKRRKGRLRRVLGLHNKSADKNINQFPQVTREVREEYPDYEVISRWLKLADEMLGNADQPSIEDYDEDTRKKA